MRHRVSVLMATDEEYTSPLVVTVTSLLANLRPGVGLDLYVMAGELNLGTRRKLEGLQNDRFRLHWVQLDHRKLEPLRGHGYPSSPAANFRLLVGSSLPKHVDKVVYLDADVLVRKDILELWEQNMHGNIVLAVQDCYVQQFPTSFLPASERKGAVRPYFNSGVMVIDLEAWRASEIERHCLEAVRLFPHATKWLDQHLLNLSLAGRWGMLAPVWNKQSFINLLPDWRCSPYEEAEFLEARHNPSIIHFCSRTKPWRAFCDHPREDILAYRAVLHGTGLLPYKAPTRLQRAVEFFAAPHRRLLDLTAAAIRARRRVHALRMMLPEMLRTAALHPWALLSVPYSVIHERTAIWLNRLHGGR